MVIPSHLHFATNTAMIGVMSSIAVSASLDIDEIGLGRAKWLSGLRWGTAVAGVIGAVVAVAGLLGVDPTNSMGERAAVGGREMLFQVFIEIPIATVLFEELAFRGVIASLLERLTSPRRALLVSSLLFGAWHVSPSSFTSWSGVGGELSTLAATAVAGVGFHLLKRKSGSLVAPMLAHWGTNGVAFIVAWSIVRAVN